MEDFEKLAAELRSLIEPTVSRRAIEVLDAMIAAHGKLEDELDEQIEDQWGTGGY